ncbi:hypothetical protein HYH02_002176 [Chlamydomonas schloesseri]|uniref:Calpain catalytic domain-containing protein n=1 Tax=Chlamydomonas schloesseri TaxID=2026947 RepID=A0A835WSE6_9CHLO|nr:hypothetical protein HYH02_002176 [Chlamydomonas schloesseri]|eukprot:KAG2452830.1 hypothetical protein HYH02_002176 [Chlamydomonas schloesseri]
MGEHQVGAPTELDKLDAGFRGAGKQWLCIGKAIFWPIILLAQAIWIYFFGCIFAYGKRLGRGVLCGLCVCCNCTYKDKKFPPTHAAIGAWENKSPEQIDREIKWRRIGDIVAAGGKTGAKLFAGKIEPADICQGGLGDCWLMSALACLANQEGAVQQVFLTKEYTNYGRYRIRLWDAPNEKWVTLTIDDWIPCNANTGLPVFAKPNGDEAWVLLLEKAMAKFKGSYAKLDGGSTMWALEALTGDYVFEFRLDPKLNKWQRREMFHRANNTGGFDVLLRLTDDALDGDEMFSTMLFYNRKRSFIAASTGSGSDKDNVNGIVQGHAYAVCNVKLVDRFQLVQLRNPWGTFEWDGAWSDKSPLWEQHPKVKRALDFTPGDDGTFWMEWKDFYSYYKCLDFCIRTTGFDDIAIDLHEERPLCGPTIGCVLGCTRYWLCCLGIRALFFSRKARHFEKPQDGGGCAAC